MSPKSRTSLEALLLVLAVSHVTGCGGASPSDPGETGDATDDPVSNQPPAVTISSPADGTTLDGGAEITFTGSASDPEDGDLTSTIAWMSDVDGELGTGGSVSVALSAGTHDVTAAVSDEDGDEGSASVTIHVGENEPPLVQITMPEDGTRISEGSDVTLEATATDGEDGDVSLSIEWSSDLDHHLGTGPSITVSLSMGTHEITATASDSEGAAGSDDITVTVSAPVAVEPLRPRIVAGFDQTCFLDAGGSAYCWGSNDNGQLGDGTGVDRSMPVPVSGGLAYQTLAAGRSFTCGVTVSADAFCWGDGFSGELGFFAGSTDILEPLIEVNGDLPLVQVSGGWRFTCGITDAGQGFCWGYGGDGQDGGSDILQVPPIPVDTDASFVQVSAGWHHACALADDGRVQCWGSDLQGQLGTTDVASCGLNRPCNPVPLPVESDLTFVQVAAGGSHSCALEASGQAYCWGFNATGQLGTGSASDEPLPVQVGGDMVFVQITAGKDHSCGVTEEGAAYCWGHNEFGQIGDGGSTGYFNRRLVPVPVAGERTFVELSAGAHHTCGIETGGGLSCWGRNDSGQLGNGFGAHSAVPVDVASLGGS